MSGASEFRVLVHSNVNLLMLGRIAASMNPPWCIRDAGFGSLAILGEVSVEAARVGHSVHGTTSAEWIHADWNYPGLLPVEAQLLDAPDRWMQTVEMLLDRWNSVIRADDGRSWVISMPFLRSHWDLGQSRSARRACFQDRLQQAFVDRWANHPRVRLLRVDHELLRMGEGQVYDDRLWAVARIPYRMPYQRSLCSVLWRLIDGMGKVPKKLLVLDLDQTLWGGVLEELGWAGVQLGHDGVGHAFHRFQEVLLSLAKRGVLLALVTRNERSEVLEALERHPDQVLRASAFVAIEAGWGVKSEAIERVVQKLGIALDSVVFLDDSVREREEVKHRCPEVSIPSLPEDPSDRAGFVLEELIPTFFDGSMPTDEDRLRQESYARRAERIVLQAATDPGRFLHDLAICLQFSEAVPQDLPRLRQLMERSNQFNLDKSFVVPELSASGIRIRVLRYRDALGSEGLVGFWAARPGKDPMLLAMALSCRVFSRGVEEALLLDVFHSTGVLHLPYAWVDSGRNQRMATLLLQWKQPGAQVLCFSEETISGLQKACAHVSYE
jgi:FkbH-like protein